MATRAPGGRKHLDRLAAAILASAVLIAGGGGAFADGFFGSVRTSAQSSATMFRGSATILRGSGQIIVGGSQFVVESVRATADGTILILRGVSEAVSISLRIVGNSVISATTLAGTVLTVSVTAAGHILHAGGEVVAFVPNSLGQTLTHSSVYYAPPHGLKGYGQTEPWISLEERRDFHRGARQ